MPLSGLKSIVSVTHKGGFVYITIPEPKMGLTPSQAKSVAAALHNHAREAAKHPFTTKEESEND